jgi:hypothetical protein
LFKFSSPHSYYRDASLVFQFLLSEFLKTVKEASLLDERLFLYKQKKRDSFRELLAPLTELCGSLPPQGSFFPWGFAEGSLNKLHTLIQQYVQLEGESKELKEIQNLIDRSLKEAEQALEYLKESEEDSSSLYVQEMIEQRVAHVLKAIKKLHKLVLSLLQNYKKNENVLFFLLRNQQDFRKIYGKRVFVQFFKETYPNGPQSLEKFLLNEYERRGFRQLAKNITEKMTELIS